MCLVLTKVHIIIHSFVVHLLNSNLCTIKYLFSANRMNTLFISFSRIYFSDVCTCMIVNASLINSYLLVLGNIIRYTYFVYIKLSSQYIYIFYMHHVGEQFQKSKKVPLILAVGK